MFTVIDLVPNAFLDMSRATAISSNGIVVGTDFGTGFVWTPNQPNGSDGSVQSLPTDISPAARPVASATPMAVNANGMVVGGCKTVDMNGADVDRAFSLVQGGILVDLGTFVPDPSNPGHFLGNSEARGVNDAGQIVGWAEDANGIRRAFLFDPITRKMKDISELHAWNLPSGTPDPSVATAINNAGDIVGSATFIDSANNVLQQAFIRQVGATTLTGLGTLLPDPVYAGLFYGNSIALALNSAALVVGHSDALPPAIMLGAIFSTPNIPFGPLPNQALGVNRGTDADQIVGHFWSNPDAPVMSGFVADLNSGMVDLNTRLTTSGWRIESATGINDFGQICGYGTHDTLGGPRAVLLAP
ncbi:MAG: DUF3466 family protein [Clostridia bacterium]|nr:DUF3466 family protein [Clostridia bacterium]